MQVCLLDQDGFHEVDSATLPALLESPSSTIWVDMVGPTEEDVRVMHDIFKFHPLAVEDTRNQEQRPKAEEYDNHLFIILNPLQYQDHTVDFRELDVFVGKNYIVVVHPEQEPIVEEARKRIQQAHANLQRTPSYVLYVLMDMTIDSYFPFLDEAGDQIETIENSILEKPEPKSLNHLFHLKRSLLNMWRVVWPQREVFNILMHHNIAYLDQESLQYYLRDVADHLMWVADMVNTLRDTLTSMMDLYMSSVGNGLNMVVNRLSIITIVIGSFTVISGFYGMNFLHTWPPFEAVWGVPFVLGVMILATLFIVGIFKWLNLLK
jgi:magnesium transporter